MVKSSKEKKEQEGRSDQEKRAKWSLLEKPSPSTWALLFFSLLLYFQVLANLEELVNFNLLIFRPFHQVLGV